MLRLHHVDKVYFGGTVNENSLFRGFDLEVERGSFVSIVGSNGSGKTSLLNLICGTLAPDAGQITLDGQDITRWPEYRRARRISRVFQDPALGSCQNLTVFENLSLAARRTQSYNLRRGVTERDRARSANCSPASTWASSIALTRSPALCRAVSARPSPC